MYVRYKDTKYIYHSVTPKLHSIMENEMCRKYTMNLFKKSESIRKSKSLRESCRNQIAKK